MRRTATFRKLKPPASASTNKRFDELEGYLYSNIGSLTDYGRAWRQGERIATANIESTVNQLINQRICKKRQMRWSRLGAQLVLHVRTAHLNGDLERYCGLPKPVEWAWANENEFRPERVNDFETSGFRI